MPKPTYAELERLLAEGRRRERALRGVLRAVRRSAEGQDFDGALQTVVAEARTACDAASAVLHLADGDALVTRAADGSRPTLPMGHRVPLERGSVAGRAFLDRQTVHLPDMLAAADELPIGAASARALGTRAYLVVPLLARGQAVGTLMLRRTEPVPFSDDQVATLESFADQAVIAIENARLFAELDASNAELRLALDRQTATSEVLQTISRSPTDLQRVLETICASAVRLAGADFGALRRLVGGGLVSVARVGDPEVLRTLDERLGPTTTVPIARTSISGRALLERRTVEVEDSDLAVAEFPDTAEIQRAMRAGSQVAVPLLGRGEPLGVIIVHRRDVRPFSRAEVGLLETFADQAAIAIENARLFQELNSSNASLKAALEQQTAASEVLATISRSSTDLDGVLDKIAESAARLCGTERAVVRRREGDTSWIAGRHGPPSAPGESLKRRTAPHGLDPGRTEGWAMLTGRTARVDDILSEDGAARFPVSHALSSERMRTYGQTWRSAVCVPMMRSDEPIGALDVAHVEVRPFTDDQVRLLQTFADQAVIAVENARLFSELQDRTAQLTRSVERLTALFEVGQAVGGTLDLQRVLDAVVARASDLAGADGGAVYEYDHAGAAFDLRATYKMDAETVAAMREARVDLGSDSVLGQAGTSRTPVQVEDILGDDHDRPTLRVLKRAGYRAVLAVPLLRENGIVGALVVRRKTPGAFDPDTVALLETFAAQSALAIQNARLFQELAVKSAQLEEASRHKSEFLANMSHELRTPLNAIIGFTEVLLEQYFGEVNPKQEDYLKDVLSSGQHLLALINDILDLSKVEAGRMELEVAPFDLGHVLEAGLVMVKERASKKGVELALELPEEPGRIEADERKVKQVLFNLLTNAVKFTPEGGKVAISARRQDGCVEVTVADTGVGIATEDLPKIFDEFGQARNQQEQTEGTGLGLALVKRYVELHGGSVRVESTVGHGSTFTLVLPIKPVELGEAAHR